MKLFGLLSSGLKVAERGTPHQMR
ncbi:uncharacterized protein G2W53_024180 [Senna tora]|uniref:Uncharacterized protein n=1 Tax=Senna tora TaxID=362788 RepID=A0A834TCV3_9FABA|nr:uncharacterized protein G2W53_024180 [Senna tora]